MFTVTSSRQAICLMVLVIGVAILYPDFIEPKVVNAQDTTDRIVIECVAKRKIKEGVELSNRNGEFIGAEIEEYLILKNGNEEIQIKDELNRSDSGKKLRYVLAGKVVKGKASKAYKLLEVWDSNLQIYPIQTAGQVRKALRNRPGNEFPVPQESKWVKKDGFEFQLTTAYPFAYTNATSFEYYVWIRNPNKVDKKFVVISKDHFFPHVHLRVEHELGRSNLLGECAKKHKFETIVIRAGETKSFKCDLFHSSCSPTKPFHSIPMAYVLDYFGAKLRFFTERPPEEKPSIMRCPVRHDKSLDPRSK